MFLLNELEPWEPKLLLANKRAKIRLRKEHESYVEEPEPKVKGHFSFRLRRTMLGSPVSLYQSTQEALVRGTYFKFRKYSESESPVCKTLLKFVRLCAQQEDVWSSEEEVAESSNTESDEDSSDQNFRSEEPRPKRSLRKRNLLEMDKDVISGELPEELGKIICSRSTADRHSSEKNKQQCSRHLQCEVPCGVSNVNSSLFINSSLSPLSSTSHAGPPPPPQEGGPAGGRGAGDISSTLPLLHYHMVLSPIGTSDNY